jgi:hypothetical protein
MNADPDRSTTTENGWCRKREEKEKEVERLLLDKENQVLEARITKYGNVPCMVQEAG